MTLPRQVRRVALVVHLTASAAWIGAAVAYVALGATAAGTGDMERARSAWVAMELIGWAVLVPTSIGSVLTGLLVSLGSRWGLLRHYWVVLSLSLTVTAAVLLILHMPDVSGLTARARRADATELDALGGDLVHSTLGVLLLLAILALNVYKPRGLTRYGWRRQNETRAVSMPRSAASR